MKRVRDPLAIVEWRGERQPLTFEQEREVQRILDGAARRTLDERLLRLEHNALPVTRSRHRQNNNAR